jgi:CHAT domain-containing protein
VFADPVLSVEDRRWKTANQRPASTVVASPAKPSAPAPGDSRVYRSGIALVPLPATEKEADEIKIVFQPYGRTETFKGFDASRDRVLKLQHEGFRIFHFATHGIVDTEHPELSGVVLSEFDANGKPQDGFLRLHDIYNLKLPADMVVLSACSTGLGQIIKGEGLISLTRGFMHAGSPRVIASLWRVEDLGTSELMKRFYQHMAKGMAPSGALRQAQIEMIRHKRWNSPYHWAGFVLQGDWRPIR